MKGDQFDDTAFRLWGKHGQLSWNLVAKLLRKEHAAVRRMVKDEMVEVAGPMGRAHNQAVERILAALDKRAKGGAK